MRAAKKQRGARLKHRFRYTFAAVFVETTDRSVSSALREWRDAICISSEKGPEAPSCETLEDDDKIPKNMFVWPKNIDWKAGKDDKVALGNSEVIELSISFDHKLSKT